PHQLRHRIRAQVAVDDNDREGKTLLRPRTINLHVIRLSNFARPNIAHNADNYAWNIPGADEQRFANWVLVPENFLRAGLADQDHLLSVSRVVLIEIAARENRNSPGLEIIGRDIVKRGLLAFIQRQHFTIRPRIKCIAATGGEQRNIRADGCAFESRNLSHFRKTLFDETLTRVQIGILVLRQRDETDPAIFRMKADTLLTQTNETRDQQCRARKQSDRKRDLRAN